MMLLCLDADEIINIIGIVVNAALGIWIAVNVQTGFAEKRFLKEHFIKNLNSIDEDYKNLTELICEGKISAKAIKSRLKSMSLRIKSFKKYIEKVYGIKNTKLSQIHSEIQSYITNLDEYNNQFNKNVVALEQSSISKLQEKHIKFADALTQYLIEINVAKPIRGYDKDKK